MLLPDGPTALSSTSSPPPPADRPVRADMQFYYVVGNTCVCVCVCVCLRLCMCTCVCLFTLFLVAVQPPNFSFLILFVEFADKPWKNVAKWKIVTAENWMFSAKVGWRSRRQSRFCDSFWQREAKTFDFTFSELTSVMKRCFEMGKSTGEYHLFLLILVGFSREKCGFWWKFPKIVDSTFLKPTLWWKDALKWRNCERISTGLLVKVSESETIDFTSAFNFSDENLLWNEKYRRIWLIFAYSGWFFQRKHGF